MMIEQLEAEGGGGQGVERALDHLSQVPRSGSQTQRRRKGRKERIVHFAGSCRRANLCCLWRLNLQLMRLHLSRGGKKKGERVQRVSQRSRRVSQHPGAVESLFGNNCRLFFEMQICLVWWSIKWWVISFLTSFSLCLCLSICLRPSIITPLPPSLPPGSVSRPARSLAVQGVLVRAELRRLPGRQVHSDRLRGQEGHGVRGGVLRAGTRWEETGRGFFGVFLFFFFCFAGWGRATSWPANRSWSSLHQQQQHPRLSPPDPNP